MITIETWNERRNAQAAPLGCFPFRLHRTLAEMDMPTRRRAYQTVPAREPLTKPELPGKMPGTTE